MSTPPLPRDQFPVADRYTYLDHANVAAPPRVVAHAVARDASAATMLGSVGSPRRDERAEQVRTTCAGLLGVSPDHLTFTKSHAEGLRVVAFGLPWADGDRILLTETEHPTTAHPWLALGRRGVAVDLIGAAGDAWSLPLDTFRDALVAGAGRVKVVVVPWVHYGRGWRTDLAALSALAHEHGAIVVADVVQGVGVIPAALAEWGVDAAVTDGHTWLLGPEGVGLLYLSPELRATLWAPPPGSPSDAVRTVRDALPPGRRFEIGTPNRLGVAGLGASAELLAGAGIDTVWAHVDQWCDHLVDGLKDLGATVVSDRSAAGRSAIVAATFGATDPAEITERLVTHGVIVSGRSDGVRFAPHAWNDDTDLEATLRALRKLWRP